MTEATPTRKIERTGKNIKTGGVNNKINTTILVSFLFLYKEIFYHQLLRIFNHFIDLLGLYRNITFRI